MSLGGIVLARMDSKRLPGKALRQVDGVPLLLHVVRRSRLVHAIGQNIVVATTTRPIDDPIQELCEAEGVALFRGPTEDVAGRVLLCATAFGMSHFVRLNGDSPYLDPSLLNAACQLVVESDLDFVTNLCPRSFPYGVSAEVFRRETFKEGYSRMNNPEHFEHVTLYFYEHLEGYRFRNIKHDGDDLRSIRMTIDTEDDFKQFIHLYKKANGKWNSWGYKDFIAALQETNRFFPQKNQAY